MGQVRFDRQTALALALDNAPLNCITGAMFTQLVSSQSRSRRVVPSIAGAVGRVLSRITSSTVAVFAQTLGGPILPLKL